MDSKGLDVCNSPDGRIAACGHDGLDSLVVGLRALRAPAQFIATKQGEAAQTGPAEYLVASAIISFEAQCSLPCLTTRTAASAHQANQSMPDQSSANIIGTKSPLGRVSQS